MLVVSVIGLVELTFGDMVVLAVVEVTGMVVVGVLLAKLLPTKQTSCQGT